MSDYASADEQYYRRQLSGLFECAAFHRQVLATCRCAHRGIFDPHQLWWLFRQRRWNDRMSKVPQRLRCSICQRERRGIVRPARVEPTNLPATIVLPWPPDLVWKQAIRRFR